MKGTLYILFTLSVCFIASSRAQVYFSYSNDNCTELIGAYKLGNVGTCMPQSCTQLSDGLWTTYVCSTLDVASLPSTFAAYSSSGQAACTGVGTSYGAALLNTCYYTGMSYTAKMTACGPDTGIPIEIYNSNNCSGSPSVVNIPYNCSSYSGGYGQALQCPPPVPTADVPLNPPSAAPVEISTPSDVPMANTTPEAAPITQTTPKAAPSVPKASSVARHVLDSLVLLIVAVFLLMA